MDRLAVGGTQPAPAATSGVENGRNFAALAQT
jgi:hypothetical protein